MAFFEVYVISHARVGQRWNRVQSDTKCSNTHTSQQLLWRELQAAVNAWIRTSHVMCPVIDADLHRPCNDTSPPPPPGSGSAAAAATVLLSSATSALPSRSTALMDADQPATAYLIRPSEAFGRHEGRQPFSSIGYVRPCPVTVSAEPGQHVTVTLYRSIIR